MMSVHVFPNEVGDTGEPTLSYTLFAGDSAALFALMAGVGLALSSGGRTPHRGQRMTADRVGLGVRALVISVMALVINEFIPDDGDDAPVYAILLNYAVFFLLSIPLLHLRPRALFPIAAAVGVISPLLMQKLDPVLPESSRYNHTLDNLINEPLGTASELLLTGVYPALVYLTYLLVGLGLGRLNLHSTRVQALIAAAGALLVTLAHAGSSLLLHAAGGYQALLATEGMDQESLDRALVFGPGVLPDTSGWWLAVAAPHSYSPVAIVASLGTAMLVLGLILLIAPRAGRWLVPVVAVGSMTLTFYSAHLLVLSLELHYDTPTPWFIGLVGGAVVFAWLWKWVFERGPLEAIVSRAAMGARIVVSEAAPPASPPVVANAGSPDESTGRTTGRSGPGPASS
jgi:uncharacterized membrane protein YeiB